MADNTNSTVMVATAALMIELCEDDDDKNDIVFAIMTHMFQSTLRTSRNRIIGYFNNVVPGYSLEEFRRLFRMTRNTFIIISNFIKNCPELAVKGEGGREPIPVEKQVLVLLWYLGGNDSITKIADRFGISESSVILCRARVIDAILNNLMSKFIIWPENLGQCIHRFSQRNAFPGIVGALDGTHIAIKAPQENPARYVNRKKFHSIHLQAVCNADMLFTDCFCGFPGSCHDSRVLSFSPLSQQGLQKCNGNHIIADGGYPLKRWLITPFRDNGHLTREQKDFNYKLSANRVVIERAVGLLKGRFRRLHFLDTQNVQNAVKIIISACVLHNICISSSEEVEDFIEVCENPNDIGAAQGVVFQENDREGIVKRNRLLQLLCRN